MIGGMKPPFAGCWNAARRTELDRGRGPVRKKRMPVVVMVMVTLLLLLPLLLLLLLLLSSCLRSL